MKYKKESHMPLVIGFLSLPLSFPFFLPFILCVVTTLKLMKKHSINALVEPKHSQNVHVYFIAPDT